MGEPVTEVIYEAPARTGAWWAAAFGGALFFAGLAWIVARMLQRPWATAAVFAVVGVALAAPRLLGQRGPLRARRVTSDGATKTLRIEHGRGVEEVGFDAIAGVTADVAMVGEGVPVDVVTVRRSHGEPVVFSVIDRAASEGAARAILAATGAGAAAGEPKPAEG